MTLDFCKFKRTVLRKPFATLAAGWRGLKRLVFGATEKATPGRVMRPEIKECRRLAKAYGVRVLFRRLKQELSGYADLDNNTIVINRDYRDRQSILSTFFHEYFHIKCVQDGLWKNYHLGETVEQKMKTAVRAERFVDRAAEMELYNYDKRIRYIRAYDIPKVEIRQFLQEFYEDTI